MIIAVDGPAASGKGTIARALAARFELPHLDTGLLYRAVALACIDAGRDTCSESCASRAAIELADHLLVDARLRSEHVAQQASVVAAHPSVRQALLERQRSFARQDGGSVLDGRDIGTVIAPDADVKLFVTARPEVRARRRHAELLGAGRSLPFEEVLADIEARDVRDRNRSSAPLSVAPQASLLDTSDLDIDAAIRRAVALVEARMGLEGRDRASG